MANSLQKNLQGKTVMVNGKRFQCLGGFGCSPSTNGSSIFGVFEDSTELDANGNVKWSKISGYEIEDLPIEE